jgi:hypothetical protein
MLVNLCPYKEEAKGSEEDSLAFFYDLKWCWFLDLKLSFAEMRNNDSLFLEI